MCEYIAIICNFKGSLVAVLFLSTFLNSHNCFISHLFVQKCKKCVLGMNRNQISPGSVVGSLTDCIPVFCTEHHGGMQKLLHDLYSLPSKESLHICQPEYLNLRGSDGK